MQTLSQISSIATLILFIFYFIGRSWTLLKDIKYPNLYMTLDMKDKDEYDEFDIDLDGNDIILAKYTQDIRWLKISKVKWKSDFKSYTVSKELKKINYVSANKEITICVNVPEGIPDKILQFELESGIQGELLIGSDGRQNSEGVSVSNIKLKKTLKAWIYYMVR